MAKRRITEITIEATESVTIRRSAGSVRPVCIPCEPAGEMLSLNEACALSRLGARNLFREIEAGRLHFQETESGSIFICLLSLQRVQQQLSTFPQPQAKPIKEISS